MCSPEIGGGCNIVRKGGAVSHGDRKHRRKRPAKAVSRPGRSTSLSHPDTASLLAAVADALNAVENAGIGVRLAHGAVITEHGYVFPVGPDDAPWAVRTRTLTPFPVPEGED
jgi:hypothetical protein